VFQSIISQLSNASTACANEDTFAHKVLGPIILPFFSDELLEYEWANRTLDASSHRKQKFDPSLQGRKPDLLFSRLIDINRRICWRWKSSHQTITAIISVKLGNELKDIIDKVIDDGVGEDIVVCGLLVEGF